MATIDYAYDLGASVYLIDENLAIKAAVVKTATIQIQYGGSVITYTVALQTTGVTVVAPEESLFLDADSALAAYKLKYLS